MKNITPANQPRLMAVLAHPDDESFGVGGTLAFYAQKGVDVHLVCATQGEAGEVEPHQMEGYQSLAELRTEELRCAANILGISDVHFLGYRDSGMLGSTDNQHPNALVAAPIDDVTLHIVNLIRQVRPQVVITFDPLGGYRHPDHIAIHKATVKAFQQAGDPLVIAADLPPFQSQKLYFHIIPRSLMRWAVRLLVLFGKDPRHWGKNRDINLLDLVGESFPVHAYVNYSPVKERKMQASACHASQGGSGLSTGVIRYLFRYSTARDYFMRAYPPPEAGLVEKDLFAGL